MGSTGRSSFVPFLGALVSLSLAGRALADAAPASPVPLDAQAAARNSVRTAPAPNRAAAQPQEASAGERATVLRIVASSGPAAGGNSVSLYGLDFQAGAAVKIGDLPTTGVTVVGPNQINATTPALAAGGVHDVEVSNPGAETGTLPEGWFTNFLDVRQGHPLRRFVEKMRRRGITAGCGAGNYCPAASVTRAQMAVFVLKAKHGASYIPPDPTGTVFSDVPSTAFAAAWIEQLAAEGITAGCGGGNYCPANEITRGQMAVFLLRAREGSSYLPEAATGIFADVPASNPFARWIEELFRRGITAGCGGGNYCPGNPNTRGQMAVFLSTAFAGSSQELIAEALHDGLIDYPTSLLYRAYALFWDARLPAAYDGAGSDGEDSGFFHELRLIWDELSAADQAALEPFLVRPDDPASVFGPTGGGRLRPSEVLTTGCGTVWANSSALGSHFRVHSCATADVDADATLRSNVNALAESLWTPMTAAPPAGMGQPKPDLFGGDSKIDIYLLATNQCRDRNGECEPIDGGAVAVAVPDDPCVTSAPGRGTCSGYILLDKTRAASPASLKTDFAHEFFHILQFAHNAEATAVDTGRRVGGEPVWDESWYTEATATWAEWKFVPETAEAEVHWRFVDSFQTSRDSLLDTEGGDHEYSAYIWPFFLQQEKGSPSPVFQSWVAIEAASNPAGINDAVDAQLSFGEHFRDFAVRNLNIDLTGDPLEVLYEDLTAGAPSGDQFPTGALPRMTNSGQIRLASAPATSVRIEALAAQYDKLLVWDEVRKLTFDFSEAGDADVDVIADIGGVWRRISVDSSRRLVFCRELPEERVDNLFVILSNWDKTRNDLIRGSYEIERKASCSCSDIPEVPAWNGTLSFSYSHNAANSDQRVEVDQSASISFRLTLDSLDPFNVSWIGTASGAGSVNDQLIDLEPPIDDPNVLTGNGPVLHEVFGAPSGQVYLTVDLETCKFSFITEPFINATATGVTGLIPTAVGHVFGDGHPAGDSTTPLSGTGNFPVLAGPSTGDAYTPGGYGTTMFIIDPGGDYGAASVSWTFTPEPPPNPAARPEP